MKLKNIFIVILFCTVPIGALEYLYSQTLDMPIPCKLKYTYDLTLVENLPDDYDTLKVLLNTDKPILNKRYYRSSKPIKIYRNNVHIDGKGITIFIDHSNKQPLLDIAANNVSVKNLNVQSNVTWVERTDDTENKVKYNAYWKLRSLMCDYGIRLYKASNIVLQNVNVSYSGYGILSLFSKKVLIEKCSVNHTMVDGIAVYHGSHDIIVRSCKTDYTGDDAFPVFGSLQQTNVSCHNVLFEYNEARHCGARSYLCHGGMNITFRNNVSYQNNCAALEVVGKEYNADEPVRESRWINIIGNKFYINKPTGKYTPLISVSNSHEIVLKNNLFRMYSQELNCDKYRIFNFSYSTNILLDNNKFYDKRIIIKECDTVRLINNKMFNCQEYLDNINSKNIYIKKTKIINKYEGTLVY